MAEEEKLKTNGAAAPITARLRKPVHNGSGEETSELNFREPTAADIERCGNPVILDVFGGETPKITFDERKMSAMMSVLAAVPPSSIKQMHPKDWNTVAWSLANFFMPDL